MTIFECMQKRAEYFRDKWHNAVMENMSHDTIELYHVNYYGVLYDVISSTFGFLSSSIDTPDMDMIYHASEREFLRYIYSAAVAVSPKGD